MYKRGTDFTFNFNLFHPFDNNVYRILGYHFVVYVLYTFALKNLQVSHS
jgi:hypothetical protein